MPMTAKEYLRQMPILEKRIKIKKSEIESLKELLCSPSIRMDGEKVQSSGDYDPMASAVVKIMEEEEKLSEMVDMYMEARRIVTGQILSLDTNQYADVLYCKYVTGMTFQKMEEVIGYCKRQLIRYHGYALLEFEKKHKDEYRDFLSQNET